MKVFAVNASQPDSGLLHHCILADSAVLPWRKPMFLPDFDPEMNLRTVPAVVIDRLGKSIPRRFASRYYCRAAYALMLRAEGLYRHLAAAGMSVSAAVSFDSAVFISPYMPIEEVEQAFSQGVTTEVDGTAAAQTVCPDFRGSIDRAIHALSQYSTLKIGDILFFDVPDRGIPVQEGNRIRLLAAQGEEIHAFTVK